MSKIKCIINGQETECEEKTSILNVARQIGVAIPTLCYLPEINEEATCRMCVVEVKGNSKVMTACSTSVTDGMVIETESEKVNVARKQTLDLLGRNHRMDCEYCPNYTFCEFHALLRRYGIDDRKYSAVYHEKEINDTSKCIVRDDSKCVRCRRCVAVCGKQSIFAVGALGRGSVTKMGTLVSMEDAGCTGCGQCVKHCPTGALYVRDNTNLIWKALNNKKKIVFGISPYTAMNIGCFFGEEEKDNIEKIAAICRKIGVDLVVDIREFIPKLVNRAVNVLLEEWGREREQILTSCPAARIYAGSKKEVLEIPDIEEIFHDQIRAIHEETDEKPFREVFTVYVTSCTAIKRKHKCNAVITTTELVEFIRRACVSRYTMHEVWRNTTGEEPDSINREAGIYNEYGGILNQIVQQAEVKERLCIDMVKTDHMAKVCKISGNSKCLYEAMGCRGGCQNGGGQFRVLAATKKEERQNESKRNN